MARCPSCAEDSPDRFTFCPVCGTSLTPRPAPVEERKVVTVLFCDLVGFTAGADNADPEDVRETLRPYHALLRTELERFGGTVEKFIGDAVMAVFGAPVAHEDDAKRAVHAAFRILAAIAALNEEHKKLQRHVRIGIATGEAVVSLSARVAEGEGIVSGDVVNTAARLQSLAPVDGIVVGQVTHTLTRDEFDYTVLDPMVAKGKATPVPRWQATAPRSRSGADGTDRRSAFVGREHDLDVLRGAFARALRGPGLQLVTVSGEPGVGKSRLLAEFRAELDDGPEVLRWRRGRCLPYGEGITFWALGEVVKAEAGIYDSDDAETATAKLSAAVGAVVADPTDRSWLSARLAPLVGADRAEAGSSAGVNREESFAAWRRYLHALTDDRPLVLLVEDVHWADPALVAFLTDLLDDDAEVPLLVVVTARPELYARHPGWGGGRPNASTVRLLPLSGTDTARLLAALLERPLLPADVQSALVARSGGNPLHAEELVRLLRDRGLLSDKGGSLELSAGELLLPDTLAAVIAARLDTLAPESKALLADAAVVGPVFWPLALAALAEPGTRTEADLRTGLRELARAELIRSVRSSSVAGTTEHAFWHALIRDIAYGQLPRASRAAKHVAVADWLEETGDRVGDRAELLAHHCGQAYTLVAASGDTARAEALAVRTAEALLDAGQRALNLDPTAAAEHYRRALELLPEGHPGRGRALRGRGEALFQDGDLDNAAADLEEAIAAFRHLGDISAMGDALVLLSLIRSNQGLVPESHALIGQAVDLLESLPPGDELARAYTWVAMGDLLSGRPQEALRAAKQALAINSTTVPWALAWHGQARWLLGDSAGIDDLVQAISVADKLGLSWNSAGMQNNLACLVLERDGPSVGLAAFRTAVSLATARGLSLEAHVTSSGVLECLVDLARWDQALRTGGELAEWAQSHGSNYWLANFRFLMAEVHTRQERFDQAEELIALCVPMAREAGELQLLIPVLTVAALVAHGHAGADTATEYVREVDGAVPHVGYYWTRSLPDLMRLALAAGDVELGRRLLVGVAAPYPRHVLAVTTARAVMAEAAGRVEEAAALYAEAAAGWERFGVPLEHAYALLGAGRCRLILGDPAGAETLQAARSVGVDIGAPALVREADRMLAQTTSRTS